MTSGSRLASLLVALSLAAFATSGHAQSTAFHRTTLQDQDFPPPSRHTVTMKAVVDPGGEVPPHTHPGLEMGYVVQGQATLIIKGQPGRPLAAGDSFAVPPHTVHRVKNAGSGPLTMVSTYVVDKGQPVASPAAW
ncbi:MAG TPA: cupin domain-containing protein [Caulobacteraceae bacterium]|nr:cupin domain-containing protein [Caulobacteraceae bacterium]